MSQQMDSAIHLVAGGLAGTTGAVVTCPLEVVKTRLQSSQGVGIPPSSPPPSGNSTNDSKKVCSKIPKHQEAKWGYRRTMGAMFAYSKQADNMLKSYNCQVQQYARVGQARVPSRMSLIHCIRYIVQHEGPKALFKGLGPNLVGVAPSRAIYFCTYSQAKAIYSEHMEPDTPFVHLLAASTAGFISCTLTNPIWFVKTRLQLDGQNITAGECIKRIYAKNGVRGFYKGISASYVGIIETVIHFVIYEAVKARVMAARAEGGHPDQRLRDYLEFMAAGAFSKSIASSIAYPHEVARTRLREEGNKYRKFWQTVFTVWKEERYHGLYRGLGTHLVRQIPNTAIVMSTYEAMVYILTTRFNSSFYENT